MRKISAMVAATVLSAGLASGMGASHAATAANTPTATDQQYVARCIAMGKKFVKNVTDIYLPALVGGDARQIRRAVEAQEKLLAKVRDPKTRQYMQDVIDRMDGVTIYIVSSAEFARLDQRLRAGQC